MPPKVVFFATDVLYNWFSQFKISCTNVWRRNSFSKLLNGFGTFDSGDPKINRVPLLPRTDVWTKFEECRSRRSWVIDQKWKGYRRTDYRPICAKQSPLFFEGGHNNVFLLNIQDKDKSLVSKKYELIFLIKINFPFDLYKQSINLHVPNLLTNRT